MAGAIETAEVVEGALPWIVVIGLGVLGYEAYQKFSQLALTSTDLQTAATQGGYTDGASLGTQAGGDAVRAALNASASSSPPDDAEQLSLVDIAAAGAVAVGGYFLLRRAG